MEKIQKPRKSHIKIGEIYFWTATLNQWNNLLLSDEFKKVITDSWQFLSDRGKIDVFSFVIMPTHLHAIWRMNEMNGKESPHHSFMKYTARTFLDMLRARSPAGPAPFKVSRVNKKHEFWRRDSLAVRLFTRKVATQKLTYIHRNPIAKGWKLSKDAESYQYSSASFYETGKTEFPFLKNLFQHL